MPLEDEEESDQHTQQQDESEGDETVGLAAIRIQQTTADENDNNNASERARATEQLDLAALGRDGMTCSNSSQVKHRASTTMAVGVLELLQEELKLEIAPRKLLRQFSLNIPPSGTSQDFRSAVLSRNVLQHGSSSALGGVLERWEKNHIKWCRHGSSTCSSNEMERQAPGMEQLLFASEELVMLAQSAPQSSSVSIEPLPERALPFARSHETFEAQFGHGFLGIEFVVDETRQEVVVKSVQAPPGAWLANIIQLPPMATIARGLIVDAINGEELGGVPPEDIFDLLQYSERPITVRFRRSGISAVVCKLCECQVDATKLNEHTNYCVMSKRFELEADQINNTLTKVATSIKTNLQTDSLRSCFHPEDLHFYNALQVIAIQASSCDATSVESFALCSRLVKILDRIRRQEPPESSSFAVDRGLKYCTHIQNLIHAKMSKMRATQKVMLLHTEGLQDRLRTPFHRTKSLEEIKNNVVAPRTTKTRRRPSACRVSIRDFQIVKPISKGAFGKVYLARKKTTGDQYAIKVLAKEHLLRKKQHIENIETERDILVNIESPFVVKLFWTFQTKQNLYLVMEYLPGGDFMSLLECIAQLEEQLTDFGLSEEAVNLSDSESEAHGVDEGFFGDGDLFLADGIPAAGNPEREKTSESPEQFGLGANISAFFDASKPPRRNSKHKKKQAHPHTYGRCGTPDYLSPEIVLGAEHGPPVDYWALGIIMYEMLVGFPPFNDDTVEAIFNNILERQILWPDGEKCLSDDAMDLISKLLEPDPALRLNWEGLTKHRFFDGIDWDTLLESIPPFVPTLEGPNDTSYFNNRNLTDIFIDDGEFEFDAKSVDSSIPDNVEVVASEDDLFASDRNTRNASSGSSSSSDTASDSVRGMGGDRGVRAGAKVDQPTNLFSSDALVQNDGTEHGENNNFKFPSGMYDSSHDADSAEPFRSFSYTNMNALAAASRTEAELITDTRLLEVENSSSLSILI
ncbi:Agc/mast/mast protein kinase, partial [Globisporangium splendens]